MAANGGLSGAIPESEWDLFVDACPCWEVLLCEVCSAFLSIVRHHEEKTPLSTDRFLILDWNAICGSK